MNDINPNDIESVKVLKGAPAAIMGDTEPHGVVLITTKKGKKRKILLTSTRVCLDKVNIRFKTQDIYGQGTGGV
jgi:hypothetical protein